MRSKIFTDSGAYSMQLEALKYATRHQCHWSKFYKTKKFWNYMRGYVEFIFKYQSEFSLYANVDVLPFGNREAAKITPEITWEHQQWLEDHCLEPVPVYHYLEDIKWLHHYINQRYSIIGLGGMVGSIKRASKEGNGVESWLNTVFDIVCDTPDRTPKIRVHGFGVTSVSMMLKFPWWSVDSTAWVKRGGYGGIFVPHRVNGRFVFDNEPIFIWIYGERPRGKRKRKKVQNWRPPGERGTHFLNLTGSERQVVSQWLEHIGVPLGKVDDNGVIIEPGVSSCDWMRYRANLLYFTEFQKHCPKYPWAWTPQRKERSGFNL